jgi:hypothetical protein
MQGVNEMKNSPLIEDMKTRQAFYRKLVDQMPYNAWRLFSTKDKFKFDAIDGQYVISKEGDYMSLKEVREALDYWVGMFNGEVTWEKE